MKKRIISMFLVVLMLLSMLPVMGVSAAELPEGATALSFAGDGDWIVSETKIDNTKTYQIGFDLDLPTVTTCTTKDTWCDTVELVIRNEVPDNYFKFGVQTYVNGSGKYQVASYAQVWNGSSWSDRPFEWSDNFDAPVSKLHVTIDYDKTTHNYTWEVTNRDNGSLIKQYTFSGTMVTESVYTCEACEVRMYRNPTTIVPANVYVVYEQEEVKAGDGKTIILHSNDVHGAIEGYAYMATVKKTYEEMGAEVIVVDAGDFSQGTTYVSLSKGKNAIDLMNLVGYDVATLGNHEFDYGASQLYENLEAAEFAITCSDVLDEDGNPIYDAYTIIEKDGVKIAFIGLETPEAQTKANPALIQGLTFLTNDTEPTLWANTQAQVDAARADGADLVVVLSHLGVDAESNPYRSVDLCEAVTGIDFVIDAHSHTVMEAGPNGEKIQSTGTAFANIGAIVIDNETKTIEENFLIEVSDSIEKDATVAAAAQKIIDDVTAEYGAVFATSEVELNGAKAPNGNRDSETNNGDLITDAMVWCVTEQYPGSITEVPAENIVAVTNGGGIRAYIHEGDVTKNDIFTVLPFGNTVTVVYVTGAELLEALEASTYCTPNAAGGFPQISGMNITINISEEYDANAETYPDSTYYGPATINRVTINDINGKDFDPEAKYAVVTNNFCAGGGDTYYAFAAASSQFDTGYTLDAVVMDYITDKLDGTITAEQYGEPQGRISILSDTFEGVVIPDGKDMLKYGHIDLDISADEFLKIYSYGDIVEVTIDGYGTFEVPVCASYDDVASGEMLLRAVPGKSYLILAINYGQIAVQQGLVELAPEGSATTYQVCEGVEFPIAATIKPKEMAKFESVVIPDGADMLKYGHLDLDINADEFLSEIPLGTQVTIEIEGYGKFEHIPVCASYDDVASGNMLLRAVSGKTYLIFAINYGQIAVQQGIVELAPDGSATKYQVCEGVSFPIKVTITEEEGTVENLLSDLVRTDNREDYAELTDAQYANFREVKAGNINAATLYRASSPINPEIGRNTYADAAAEAAGVKTFINLADTEAEATGYAGYSDTYYSAQNHIFLGLPVAFTTDTFKEGLAEGFRYIISNEGPYLVHCTEGKDRAGLTAAILECLCGATYEEVLADYVETYRNYYSVEDGTQRALTEKEITAIEDVILANLKLAFGTEIKEDTDLVAAAEAYMTSIGLTEEETEQLKEALCGTSDPCEGYTDIDRDSWYHTAADFVIENGYMGSTKTDALTFEPTTKVSRAMVASIMYRIAGSPDVEYKASFTDVADGKWFTKAIEWCAQNGLASGKGDGKFDPNGNVTRQELAVFMYKLAEHLKQDVSGRADLSKFSDEAKVPSWAKSYVQWAVSAGLISGKGVGDSVQLAPTDNATRAEFASIIMRFMSKK